MADTVAHRSMVGGALGDAAFEIGDIIDVPSDKVDAWLAAGLITPLTISPANSTKLSSKEAQELIDGTDV